MGFVLVGFAGLGIEASAVDRLVAAGLGGVRLELSVAVRFPLLDCAEAGPDTSVAMCLSATGFAEGRLDPLVSGRFLPADFVGEGPGFSAAVLLPSDGFVVGWLDFLASERLVPAGFADEEGLELSVAVRFLPAGFVGFTKVRFGLESAGPDCRPLAGFAKVRPEPSAGVRFLLAGFAGTRIKPSVVERLVLAGRPPEGFSSAVPNLPRRGRRPTGGVICLARRWRRDSFVSALRNLGLRFAGNRRCGRCRLRTRIRWHRIHRIRR